MTTEACKKVSSMLSLYIDNKVTPEQKSFIDEHLANCEECYKKYVYLKSLIKNLKDSYKQVLELARKKQQKADFNIKQHEIFLQNLSPYIDNELDAQDCFEFRKYLIKSKNAQKELKNIYTLQKEMKKAYAKTEAKLPYDQSKYIKKIIKNGHQKSQSFGIQNIFDYNPKIAKIAILSGLALFSAAEIKYITSVKPPQKVTQGIINAVKSNPAISKIFKSIR